MNALCSALFHLYSLNLLTKRIFRLKTEIIVVLICFLFLCASLTNCGGGGAKVESNVSTQTLGQQLTLQRYLPPSACINFFLSV